MQESIGIFDSGIGGLTVFREIARRLPEQDLIYLGDTARVPYGTKSAATVTRYSLQNLRFLIEQKVRMVVVACNTASAFALEELKREFEIPILGVVEPGVKAALRGRESSSRIGVIGTEGTIQSGAYEKAIRSKDPGAFVTSAACPLFVSLAEEGWWEGAIVEEIAHRYLDAMLQERLDTLILGCTHYPLLKETLKKVVGPRVTLIDSAEETAREVSVLIESRGKTRKKPARTFFVTDLSERFRRVGSLFLGEPIQDIHHVEI